MRVLHCTWLRNVSCTLEHIVLNTASASYSYGSLYDTHHKHVTPLRYPRNYARMLWNVCARTQSV